MRIVGPPDRQLTAWEQQIEDTTRQALQQVMDQIADRITGSLTAALVAHLPGKHDQSSHGRGGTSRLEDFDRRRAAAAVDAAALDAAPHGFGDGGPELDAALDSYAGSGFAAINRDLRAGVLNGPESGADIAALDAGMRRSALTGDVRVLRGVRDPGRVFGDAWDDTDVTGLEWTDAGFASATANSARIRSGRNFHTGRDPGGVAMDILVPAGTRALAVGRRDSSQFGETELVLDRGLTFRVVRDNGVDEDGIRRLDVEVGRG